MFDYGEALRDAFGWQTSGIEALYAYGYFTDLLTLLKHISVDRANGGPSLAVLAYCILPAIFIGFERKVLTTTLDYIVAGDKDAAEIIRKRHRRDIECFDNRTIGGKHSLPAVSPEQAAPLIEELRSLRARKVISRAWNHAIHNRLLATVSANEWPPEYAGEDNISVIDAITDLSKQMTDTIPTLAIVRLWRLLAEWAQDVSATFWVRREFLPDVFSTFDEEMTREYARLDAEAEADEAR